MKAFVITGPFATAFEERPEPEMGPEDVLLEVKYVGLCGSDLNTYRNCNPMVTLPRIPGHEISAVIAAKGRAVPDDWSVGQAVTVSPYTSCGSCSACLADRPNCCRYNQTLGVQRDGAITERISVPYRKLFAAGGLTQPHIALVEPLTVGNHAADRSGVNEDALTVVFGCGAVGLGAIAGAAAKGATVAAVDIDDAKLELARAFGAAHTINSEREDLTAAVDRLSGGRGADALIEAVGLPQTFRAAVELAAFAGSVTYIGYAKQPVEYETKLFVQKELNIQGSRNALPVNFRRVIKLMQAGKIPAERMISRIFPFAEAGEALAFWARNPAQVCRLLIEL